MDLWRSRHPKRSDVLTYTLASEAQPSDLLFLTQNQAGFQFDTLSALDMSALHYDLPMISPELNLTDVRFMPLTGEGFAFITHLTQLEEMGVDISDVNQDNLVDAVDTFEKIQTLQKNWPTDQASFIFSLNEPYSFYPFLTASGWQLFETHDALDPRFEDERFLESLKFIQTLSKLDWNGTKENTAAAYDFAYSHAFQEDDFIFSIVSTWMFVEDYQALTDSKWQVSLFPSMNQDTEPLTPFLREVKGYVLSSNARYPSASHEVLRLIQSTSGLQSLLDTTNLIPLGSKTQLNQLSFIQDIRKQFALAFTSARSEPLIALEKNVGIPAFSLYFDIDFMPKIQALWNGEMTAEETRNQIMMASDAWLYEHQQIESDVQGNE